MSQKPGGVKGKKRSKVNLTGAEGDGKTKGEDKKINGMRLEIFVYRNFINIKLVGRLLTGCACVYMAAEGLR